MELPPHSSPAVRPSWRRPGVLTAALVLACYGLFLAHYVNACAGGSDSSGYLNQAHLLSSAHAHAAARVLPGLPPATTPDYLYTPLGFKPAPDGRGLVGTYPIGLPILIAAAAPLAGWRHACDLVIVLHALAGILLVYALGRLLRLSPAWALVGATVLAASPLYVEYALQAMSDLPAMVWVAAAIAAAWRSAETSAIQPRRTRWAVAAGAAFALAVLIRPSNLLALAPLAIALGRPSRRWLWFALGGLPGAAFLAVYNHDAYGHVLTTGYGSMGGSFSRDLVPLTLRHYLRWLPLLFTPIVGLAVFLPWAARRRAREALLLGVWALVFLSFYAAYYNTHETWWYLRFVLPAAPALIIGGLTVLADSVGSWAFRSRGPRLAALGLALAAVLANGAYWNNEFQTWSVGHGEATYPDTAAWLQAHVPADAILGAMQVSGALFYYTDFAFVRWDEVPPGYFPQIVAAARGAHRPLYAALYRFETDEALKGHLAGHWTPVGAIQDVTVWRYQE